jgi:hypothetical protein
VTSVPGGRSAPIGLLLLFILALAGPVTTNAADGGFKLVLAPVGQPGPFFELTIRPGDSVHLAVDLANDGDTAVSARTYAADVYTITNGGYGGRLRDTPQTGTTTWLAYPTTVLVLGVGEHVTRGLTVTVPPDAGPGEYLSSLVLENDTPVRTHGNIGFDQVARQAIAVAITVPGVREPRLTIGAARHDIVAGKSIVAIAVQNEGNTRLRPTVEFTLWDATGAQVSQTTFGMDTFYAHTDTLVAVPLAALLLPGRYTVDLGLTDAPQAVHVAAALDLVVAEPALATREGLDGPALTGVVQGPADQSEWLGLGAALVLLVAGIGAAFVVRRRLHPRP